MRERQHKPLRHEQLTLVMVVAMTQLQLAMKQHCWPAGSKARTPTHQQIILMSAGHERSPAQSREPHAVASCRNGAAATGGHS